MPPLCAQRRSFSALQRAEIAEIQRRTEQPRVNPVVSVLFNEPKLLKLETDFRVSRASGGFSALQRAEIAEIENEFSKLVELMKFQCSSTSRNC